MSSILYFVPKNLLSALVGWLASIRLPGPLKRRLFAWYANRYGIIESEAEHTVNSYPNLKALFTRNLRADARPMGDGLVSPVDGRMTEQSVLTMGRLIQVKGRDYTLAGLVDDGEVVRSYLGGAGFTLYLAPGDYHHIHAPFAGTLRKRVYIPGALWPVNPWSVENISEVFCRNERVILDFDSARGRFAVVMVGATNVGSIRTPFETLTTNRFPWIGRSRAPVETRVFDSSITVAKGDRIGSFILGSTVVLLLDPAWISGPSLSVRGPGPVRYGQSLGLS